MFDPAHLRDVAPTATQITGYRHQAPDFDPRSGEGARRFGGRFNPPQSFPVIYLCTTQDCCAAELRAAAARQGLDANVLLPRELWAFELELEAVLDLTDDATLRALDLTTHDLVRPDHELTQQIGEAAHERRFQAIRSHSATDVDDVVALFIENLGQSTMQPDLVEVWNSLPDIP